MVNSMNGLYRQRPGVQLIQTGENDSFPVRYIDRAGLPLRVSNLLSQTGAAIQQPEDLGIDPIYLFSECL